MKKFVGILMIIVMVLTANIALANSPEILYHTFDWWYEANKDTIKMFHETVYFDDGFVKDGIAYFSDDYVYLMSHDDCTIDELEKMVEETFKKNWIAADCEINVIGEYAGRKIMEVSVITDTDLRYAGETNTNYDEPVYGLYVICWDRSIHDQ